jgi:hypothetical protein
VIRKVRTLRLAGAALLVALTIQGGQAAQGSGTLWYNGDYDNRDALLNTTGTIYNINGVRTPYNSYVYDNFIVPVGQTWTVDGVFSNNQMNFSTRSATWEIRQGVSAGNGGTIVASGDDSATQTALPPVSGFFYGTPEYRIAATISPVVLTAGTYWLTVAPDAPGNTFLEQGFIETTSGANAVGMPPGNDGNSFINNNFPSSNPGALNFVPTSTVEAPTGLPGPWDYSMGLTGTFTRVTVPEPPTTVLLVLGLTGVAVAGFSRRDRRATSCVATRP